MHNVSGLGTMAFFAGALVAFIMILAWATVI